VSLQKYYQKKMKEERDGRQAEMKDKER